MSVHAELSAVPSPRTPERPRAFSCMELVDGGFWAWLWFQPMVAAAVAVAAVLATHEASGLGMALMPVTFGLPVTVATTIVGTPIAYVLGRALRRQRNDLVHLAVFGAYGLVLAGGVARLLFPGNEFLFLSVASGAAGAVALPLGWWTTSRFALRKDRRAATTPGSVGPR